MGKKITKYCLSCSENILGQWKGWPHKDFVPLLPRIIDGICEECSKTNCLESTSIAWLNYHGPYNTGLPDYWLLVPHSTPNKWGLPYYSEGNCPSCNFRTTLSEMFYPNGTHEIMHNCPNCGVIRYNKVG